MSKPLAAMCVAAAMVAVSGEPTVQESPSAPALPQLQTMTARFAPADIGADLGALPENERSALAKLVAAARVMDAIFLKQVWPGNDAMLQSLSRDALLAPAAERDLANARLHYFLINKGPWDRLDHNTPFIGGAASAILPPTKPPQANFYPADATKADVEKWISGLARSAHADATGLFTVIRRDPNGKPMNLP